MARGPSSIVPPVSHYRGFIDRPTGHPIFRPQPHYLAGLTYVGLVLVFPGDGKSFTYSFGTWAFDLDPQLDRQQEPPSKTSHNLSHVISHILLRVGSRFRDS